MKTFLYSVLLSIFSITSFSHAQGWRQLWNGLPIFYAISAVDTNICWVGGDWSTVMKSTDAGKKWVWAGNGLVSVQVSSMCAKSSTLAWLGTGNGQIYKTTDGQNWVQKYSYSGAGATYINAVYLFDDNTGIAIGDPPSYPNSGPFLIVRTTDNGETWNQITSGVPSVTNQYGYSVNWDVVGNNFWFGSAGSATDTTIQFNIYRTTDHGLTWETITPPSMFGEITSLSFSDPLNGLISGPFMHAARTIDGGNNWQMSYNGKGILKFRKGSGTVWGRDDYNIYKSTDYGTTWIDQGKPAGPPVYAFSLVSSLPSQVVWACGFNFLILRTRSDGDATSVSSFNIRNSIPVSFDLNQNYPNPFNPMTNIKYRLQKGGHVRLSIYDVLGNEIRTLIDDNQQEGWHLTVWDGLDNNRRVTSTGTYFYEIENDGQREVKRMMFIK